MSRFVRAVSLRIGGFLIVLGGFLIFASASYACPYGQRDRCGHVTLIRVVASLVSRLRPRRMLLGLPLARNQRATSAPDPKEDRWAAFYNDGAIHGLKSMSRRVASNASPAAREEPDSALDEGDMRPDQVKKIAHRLDVTEQKRAAAARKQCLELGERHLDAEFLLQIGIGF
jgi:hypothetical protein